MQKVTTAADLKNAIKQLEYEQASEWILLKKQFFISYESMKPINVIKSTFKEMVLAPDLKTNIINTAIGVTTGFLTKKILIGKTHNHLTKLLGIIVEMVVANKITKNAGEIKAIGSIILKKIINQSNDLEKI
jgi:hypothetical protein